MVEPPLSFDGGPYVPMSQCSTADLKEFIYAMTYRPSFVTIYNDDGYDEDFIVRYAVKLLQERGV